MKLVRQLHIRIGQRERPMRQPERYFLTDEDIRYEFRVMVRWCRLFQKTDVDWVELGAVRFRNRHPVLAADSSMSQAA
jgi:hypothetical protein